MQLTAGANFCMYKLMVVCVDLSGLSTGGAGDYSSIV